ncbi:restriction endonuclease subunit S [Mitsuokella sp. AF33-22]|uniref:restriction endonuclease subunit S n=1 Tax=Mitsuokella sp. AF33-22 TaxID=2292047 RepID=UPI000E4C94A4|nr:restriction endonuclease subunit S [Mitsuokella sp. AF33-22]RHM56363.1 restriction endonuclease subunit S [Mitsuokella sp. AF33-22]
MMDNTRRWDKDFPAHWERVPLKSKFSLGKGLSIKKTDLTEEGENVISYGQIHAKWNSKVHCHDELIRHTPKAFCDGNNSSIAIRNGFIFADTSEDLDGVGNCAFIDSDEKIYAGYHTVLLTPTEEKHNNKYLAYLFTTDAWRYQIRKNLTEVKVFSISQKALKQTFIVLPPSEIQSSIVSFLDRKCAAIDDNIAKHKVIIEKLGEYWQAEVTRAVTAQDGWTQSRIKFVVNVVRGGSPRPIDEYITDGDGFNWIKIGDATGNGRYIDHTKQKIKRKGLNKTRFVKKGTLLLTNSMSFGHPYVLNIDGCIHDGWLAFSDFNNILPEYLYYYLESDIAMKQFTRSVDGSVVNNLNIEKVKNAVISFPDAKTQADIVKVLDKTNSILDNAVNKHNQLIAKLEEYKKSLIYNAVTGKIDCRKENYE